MTDNITIPRATVQQALKALEEIIWSKDSFLQLDAITAIRTALEQQQAEPVAVHQWRKQGCADWYDGHPDFGDGGGPYEIRTLYTAPPQRKPLTDEQVDAAMVATKHMYPRITRSQCELIIRAAAHGIKANT